MPGASREAISQAVADLALKDATIAETQAIPTQTPTTMASPISNVGDAVMRSSVPA